jgi:hypothetical protein
VYTSKLPQLFRKEFVTKIKIQTELANVVEENKLVTFKAARYSFKRNTSFGWESLLSHLLRDTFSRILSSVKGGYRCQCPYGTHFSKDPNKTMWHFS